jgi:hypothetical protein
MPNRKISPTLLRLLDDMERIACKFEADLIATGRFKYVRTDGERKIYIELATGREVPVLMPSLYLKRTA